MPARRVRTDEILGAVTRALDARFGPAHGLVARYLAPDVYLDLDAHRAAGLARRDVEAVVEAGAAGDAALVEPRVHARAAAGRRRPRTIPTSRCCATRSSRRAARTSSSCSSSDIYLERPAGRHRPRHALRIRPPRAGRVPGPGRAGRRRTRGLRARRTSRPRWPRCSASTTRCRTRSGCSRRCSRAPEWVGRGGAASCIESGRGSSPWSSPQLFLNSASKADRVLDRSPPKPAAPAAASRGSRRTRRSFRSPCRHCHRPGAPGTGRSSPDRGNGSSGALEVGEAVGTRIGATDRGGQRELAATVMASLHVSLPASEDTIILPHAPPCGRAGDRACSFSRHAASAPGSRARASTR